MNWLQARVILAPEQAPAAEALFEALGALSVTLEDAADQPMFEPAPGTTPLWRRTRVTGLFDAQRDPAELRGALHQLLPGHEVVLEPLADQPWERAWLAHFRPMRFGRRLVVCPSGHQVEDPDAVVIHLDPGLAFGTGTHPTTALCLEWLDGADLEGATVVDYGCGSGILAVAALRLGAARVIALDHDPQALAATAENARRNGVAERLEVRDKPPAPGTADLVLANILANVLIDLAPVIGALPRPGGALVLSGLLEDQAEDVARAYQPRFRFAPPVARDQWLRLEGQAA